MLDEVEFAEVSRLYRESMMGAKEYRKTKGTSLADTPVNAIFEPVRDKYEQITGMKESNENAIMHHRISLYGPPCKRCQKPLRTPRARLCGSCMFPVED